MLNLQTFIDEFMDSIKKDFSVANIQTSGETILAAIGQLSKIVEALAPLAEAVAPFTGSAAPAVAAGAVAADGIATAVDTAITAHQAAPSPATAAAGLASVAQAVACSGLVNSSTATQITTMTNALDPAVASLMTSLPTGA